MIFNHSFAVNIFFSFWKTLVKNFANVTVDIHLAKLYWLNVQNYGPILKFQWLSFVNKMCVMGKRFNSSTLRERWFDIRISFVLTIKKRRRF